jgi:hypothetical protein
MLRRSPEKLDRERERDPHYASTSATISSSYETRSRLQTDPVDDDEGTPEPGQIFQGHGHGHANGNGSVSRWASHPSLPVRREWEIESDPGFPPSVGETANASGSHFGSVANTNTISRRRSRVDERDTRIDHNRGRWHSSSRSRSTSRDWDSNQHDRGGAERDRHDPEYKFDNGNGSRRSRGLDLGTASSLVINTGQEVTAALNAFSQ